MAGRRFEVVDVAVLSVVLRVRCDDEGHPQSTCCDSELGDGERFLGIKRPSSTDATVVP